jgi:hypothetical protein
VATYHLSLRVGGKGKAGPHYEYIARQGEYSELRSGERLEHVASGNLPKWAEHDPALFWQAADAHERAKGSTYREAEIALPRELSMDERRALVQEWVRQEIGDKHAYSYAIHNPRAAIEKGEQPHAHIMWSERTRDGIERDPQQYFKRANSKNPERGGCKKANAPASRDERKQSLVQLRERWAAMQNRHLERHGHAARVDHRSLKDQGIDRPAEKHLGPVESRKKANVIDLQSYRQARKEAEQLQRSTKQQVIDLGKRIGAEFRHRVNRLLNRNQPSQGDTAMSKTSNFFDAALNNGIKQFTGLDPEKSGKPKVTEHDRAVRHMAELQAHNAAQARMSEQHARETSASQARIDHLEKREADRDKLNQATGKEHHFRDQGTASGRYVGKVQLGGQQYARLDEGRSVGLVKYDKAMGQHLGKDITVMQHERGVAVERTPMDRGDRGMSR